MNQATKKTDEVNGTNGWTIWRTHVLKELERTNTKMEKIDTSIGNINVEIGQLKVKSGVWGLIGGGISVLMGLVIYFVSVAIQNN